MNPKLPACLSGFALWFATAAAVADPDDFPLEAMVAGEIHELSEQASELTPLDSSGLIWAWHREFLGSNYLRLHFSDFENPSGDAFRMVISNGDGQEIVYDQDSLPGAEFWTPTVLGGRVSVRVMADPAPAGLRFTLAEAATQTEQGRWESIIGTRDLQHMREFDSDPEISRVGRAVAKLTFFDDGFKVCSGFLVAPNQLLTNHHCVATDEVCETTSVMFGYQLDASDVPVMGEQFACRRVLAQDFVHDFALLELHGEPGLTWGTLPLADGEVDDQQPLYIVQHPAGEPKQVAQVNCNADGAVVDGRDSDTDLAHVCDTMGGSSGSPVLNLQHEVVALHHFGVGQGNFWNKNRAVRIGLVAARLPQPPTD